MPDLSPLTAHDVLRLAPHARLDVIDRLSEAI